MIDSTETRPFSRRTASRNCQTPLRPRRRSETALTRRIALHLSFSGILALVIRIPDAAGKEPAPERGAQTAIAANLADEFHFDEAKTPAAKVVLARRLWTAAKSKSGAGRYVMLKLACDNAAEGGAFEGAMQMINEMDQAFEIDASSMRGEALVLAAQHPREAKDTPKLLKRIGAAIDDATARDQSELALRLADAACAAAKDTDQYQNAVARRDELKNTPRAGEDLARSRAALELDPTDPAANLAMGRDLCFVKGDWGTGLPMLALGNDAGLAELAAKDMTGPTDARELAALGDAWWDRAEGAKGVSQRRLREHAAEFYRRALAGPVDDSHKQQIRKRLAELPDGEPIATTASLPTRKPDTSAPPSPAGRDKKPAAAGELPNDAIGPGVWVDLLAWAEEAGDVSGRGYDWNAHLEGPPVRSGINLKSMDCNRFPVPAIIDGDYELETEFIRHEGSEAVGVAFPVGVHNMRLEFGAGNGSVGGVGCIGGKWFTENETGRRPCQVTNNVKHRIAIRVRRDIATAEFNVDWDNEKNYIDWKGTESLLPNVETSPWKLSMVRRAWLASYFGRVTFDKFRIRMTSGTIRRDFITAADRARDLSNGFIRLIGEKANSPTVGWGRWCVNQIPLARGPAEEERLWPMIALDARPCHDFYYAHAPSRIFAAIPPTAKSFSVAAYNDCSRTTKACVYVDGRLMKESLDPFSVLAFDLPHKAATLELVSETLGNRDFDQSYWCYPRFHSEKADDLDEGDLYDRLPGNKLAKGKAPGKLAFVVTKNQIEGEKLTYNTPPKNISYAPVDFKDATPCDEFIFAHATSAFSYAVPEEMTRFTAIGYCVKSKHVRFEVFANGVGIYRSPTAGIVPIDVKLPKGTRTLELRIDNLGSYDFDVSMWCYPRLHKK